VPPDDLSTAVQQSFHPGDWVAACEVAFLESGWRATALNDTVSVYGPCGTKYWLPSIGSYAQTELSAGYFQINACAHGGTPDYWYDATRNVSKAASLRYGRGNWGDWLISAHKLGLPT
jgi:hypothetical protein